MPAQTIEQPRTSRQASARATPSPEPITSAPAQTSVPSTPMSQASARATTCSVPRRRTPAQHSSPSTKVAAQPARRPSTAELLATIRNLGNLLDDLEKVRIANGLRIGAMERDLGEALPHLHFIQEELRMTEHRAELELVRAWRKHPLAAWAKGVRGVGEKSIARLIAEIGDPADRANVAKLWAYCGHGDPARKRRRGMGQEEAFRLGNPKAKMRVYLIATAYLKSGNRDGYDAARAHYAVTRPEWTPGHAHAAALRKVGKEFLKDLWVTARQTRVETQMMSVGGDPE